MAICQISLVQERKASYPRIMHSHRLRKRRSARFLTQPASSQSCTVDNEATAPLRALHKP